MEPIQKIYDMTFKVLITGGAGFVGRRLTHRLLKKNWQVHIVDNLVEGGGGLNFNNGWPLFNPKNYPNFSFEIKDCRKFFYENLKTNFDYVFHLAAVVGGRQTIENNPIAIADDLSIDAHFWQWAVKTKPGKVVCFSSSAAYPINLQGYNNTLLEEGHLNFDKIIGLPDMTYGWAKLTCEFLAKVAVEKHNLPVTIFRPFSGYGEDQSLAYPFPSICRRAIERMHENTIEIWGSGKQGRDFIHIDDCVTGILKLMDQGRNGETFNLSTGILTNFHDLVKKITNLLGYDPHIIANMQMPEGVMSRAGSGNNVS
jgi:GDP-L-fucose synthase